ncbi:MAG TPA: hypothetical protein VN284_00720 [Rhizobium sp.]|nr:hypothetical protein [Rhizobium sp.]
MANTIFQTLSNASMATHAQVPVPIPGATGTVFAAASFLRSI